MTALTCEYFSAQPFGHGLATSGGKFPPDG